LANLDRERRGGGRLVGEEPRQEPGGPDRHGSAIELSDLFPAQHGDLVSRATAVPWRDGLRDLTE
jgi:hypothetical protein